MEKLLTQMRDAPPDGFAPGQGNPYTNKPEEKPEEESAPDWKGSPSSDVATSTGTVLNLSIVPILSNVYQLVVIFPQLIY